MSNDDFWKALIKGLAPQNEREVHLWWAIPMTILIAIFIISLVI